MGQRVLSEYPWLEASLIAFNGSGYADRTDAGTYMESYLAYQTMKNREYGMEMATKYWGAGLVVAETVIETSPGASHHPSSASLKRFGQFYPPARG